MPNLKQIISGQNKKILEKVNKELDMNEANCKCRGGIRNCPIEGRGRETELIYERQLISQLRSTWNVQPQHLRRGMQTISLISNMSTGDMQQNYQDMFGNLRKKGYSMKLNSK